VEIRLVEQPGDPQRVGAEEEARAPNLEHVVDVPLVATRAWRAVWVFGHEAS
jgi:hypothetical protein